MTIAMERILAWKLLLRVMMGVMCCAYRDVLKWSMTLPPDAMTSQATALTATVTGAFAVWLGHEKSSQKFLLNLAQFRGSGVRPSCHHAAAYTPF